MPRDDQDPTSRLLDWRLISGSTHHDDDYSDEGLRERKKRLMRQQISDTATMLFLEHGFDEMKITDVAELCGVSEKTIYNYFPTKESLILDREEDMAQQIRDALGPNAEKTSPVEAMVKILEMQTSELVAYWQNAGLMDMTAFQLFVERIEETPSLRAAQMDMMQRLVQVAAVAMAERAGVDPLDPEPQIAAESLIGLWRIYFLTIAKYCTEVRSPLEVQRLMMASIQRAARLIDTGLWSFGMAVQGANGREQLKVAADASNEARKQVVQAMKQARDAWKQIKNEFRDQAHEDRDFYRSAKVTQQKKIREAAEQLKREAHRTRDMLHQEKRNLMRDIEKARRNATPGATKKKPQ